MRNPSVGSDESLCKKIVSSGHVSRFIEGQKIISENEFDDDVYFLLSGETSVKQRKKEIALRMAPNHVGEMAAINPGTPRSASIFVSSKYCHVLKIGGSDFFEIWKSNPGFSRRLNLEMVLRNNEQNSVHRLTHKQVSLNWFVISILFAALTTLVTFGSSLIGGLNFTNSVITATGAFLVSFTISFLWNPLFFWRRCFGLVLAAFLGNLIVANWFNFGFYAVAEKVGIKIAANDPSQDSGGQLILFVSMITIMVLCAVMEKVSAKS